MRRLPLLLLAFALPAVPAGAAEPAGNWPQWRGPLACGFVPDGDPPLKWDEKTNVRWKVPLPGRGSSTPAVWGDRVFVLAAEDTGRQARAEDIPKPDPRFDKRPVPPTTYHRFYVLCFDRNTGKESWRRLAREAVPHEGHHESHSYAAYSPVTDGERLYAHFGSHGTYCYSLDGKLLWERDLGRMETRLGWGEGGSPALHGDTLVITFDHEGDSFLTALDAKTGEPRWKKDRDEPSCWATPLIVTHGGTTQVVVNGTGKVRGYDLATGEVLWECAGQTVNAIPSPVTDGKFAYCMSGYRGAFATAIPLGVRGDLTDSDKLPWRHSRGTPYVPSPLLMHGRLYFTQGRENLLTCLDAATGKVLIDRERLPGVQSFYASPVGVKDRIYLTSREGTTLVLKADVNEVEVLATNRLDDDIDASPVVVGRQLFLRGHGHLYCIEEK